jgi:endonuclease III
VVTHSEASASRAAAILGILRRTYGEPTPRSQVDPLDELIATILSQSTSDTNSGRAFASLREAFPTWAEVLAAPVDAVSAAIRIGGLADTKARYIHRCLAILAERRGELSLGFLDALDSAAAAAVLTAMPGVGAKTAACVLLFALGRPVIPVDTHVHRVARRLGLAPADASPERVEAALESQYPADSTTCYHLHLHLVTHGRQVCGARTPACVECPLLPHCQYGAGHLAQLAPASH